MADSSTPESEQRKLKRSKIRDSTGPIITTGPAPLTDSVQKTKKRKRGSEPAPGMRPVNSENTVDEPLTSDPMVEDAPVLSHAAARKRKKEATKPSTPAETEAAEADSSSHPGKKAKRDNGKKEKPSEAKRQHSVWVGNLSFKTSEVQLHEFFQFAGSITRVNMPMKDENGRKVNRGFAYVDFATPDAQKEAITYSERNLDGRRLLIKDGSDFAGRPTAPTVDQSTAAAATPAASANASTGLSHFAQKVLKRQKQPPAPTLFMGNLGFEATADSIRMMIEAHERVRDERALTRKKNEKEAERKAAGIILDDSNTSDSEKDKNEGEESTRKESSLVKVRVGTFEDSGNCKGFAFLDFRTPELATVALTDPRNFSMDGRELKLEFASADAVRRSGLQPKPKITDVRGLKSKGRNAGARVDNQPREFNPRTEKAQGDTLVEEGAVPVRKQRPSAKALEKAARMKPGAALANAQREHTGIVQSLGKKIVF